MPELDQLSVVLSPSRMVDWETLIMAVGAMGDEPTMATVAQSDRFDPCWTAHTVTVFGAGTTTGAV
jgi:hypothetical protein